MSRQFTELRPSARLYVLGVIGLGAVTVVYSAVSLVQQPVGWDWLVLAALTLLTGSFSIKVPSVTGWCGANRRTAINSDASLDLAQIAQLFQPPLHSTISAPLADGERLIAALTAYSLKEDAFTESHRYTFEQVSSALVGCVSSLRSQGSMSVLSFPMRKN